MGSFCHKQSHSNPAGVSHPFMDRKLATTMVTGDDGDDDVDDACVCVLYRQYCRCVETFVKIPYQLAHQKRNRAFEMYNPPPCFGELGSPNWM